MQLRGIQEIFFRQCSATATVLLSAAPVLVYCSNTSPVGRDLETQGWIRASVAGAVERTFEDEGYFSNNPDVRLGLDEKFQFGSPARRPEELEAQSIWGGWRGGIPQPGTYQLISPEELATSPGHFALSYELQSDGRRKVFAASDGTLEITRSARDQVEGRFEATVWLYCVIANGAPLEDDDFCVTDPNVGLPKIEEARLSGEFLLRPHPGFGVPD
ncbi:MAG: hypothetical protein ACREK7_04065 [Gemmatimonadota bacterium]